MIMAPEKNDLPHSSRDLLLLKTPSSWADDKSKEALPAGNGKTGILVCGGVKTEMITVNRHDLWHNTVRAPLPDISPTLAQVRQALDQGDFRKANSLACDEIAKRKFAASVGAPFSLGILKLDFHCPHEFTHYRRTLDMSTGEIVVSYTLDDVQYRRSVFVSRDCDAVIMEITATKPKLSGSVQIGLHPLAQSVVATDMLSFHQRLLQHTVIHTGEQHSFFKSTNDDGQEFGAVLNVSCDGTPTAGERGKHTFDGATKITILLKTFAGTAADAAFATLQAELETLKQDYADLLARHARLHRAFFTSASLEFDLPTAPRSNEELLLDAYEEKASLELLEKAWRFGRYLFVSGSDPATLPFPLYGLWHYGYGQPWSQHVANENVEMIYWHPCVGGLAPLVKPLIDYYFSLMDDFRENARKLFGCRGIYVSAYTSPGMGLATVNVPVILNWIGGAGWLARHFYEYCRFTGDERTLREKVLPFMREAALFYQDYSVIDADGKLKLYPSISPENTPKNFIPENFAEHMGHALPTAINATMDFAILKELLTNLLAICQSNSMHAAEIPAWQEMLARIPDYMLNPAGDVKEWMHPDLHDHYNHRHLSHLYPVFPGNEIHADNRPQLLGAFEKAVAKRQLGGQSGWSLAHMANLYARMGQGEVAVKCLDTLSRACLTNSFMTLHNDWRDMGLSLELPEFTARQLDANMGLVNAMQEMLFSAFPGLLKILPGCPKRFAKGRVERFCFETGTVSFHWDLAAKTVTGQLVATTATRLTLKLPAFCATVTGSCDHGTVTAQKTSLILDLPVGAKLNFEGK